MSLGYACPFLDTYSTGGDIRDGGDGYDPYFFDPDVIYRQSNTLSTHVRIEGAANAGNNGLFSSYFGGTNTFFFRNAAWVAETLPSTAWHMNYSFAGVHLGMPDPGYLRDVDNASISLTPGGAMDFASFTAATTATVGDDFDLSTPNLNLLNSVPRNGSSFTIACSASSCPGGSASFTQLDIVTTDVSTAGLGPFAMPAPSIKSVRIQCRAVGTLSITVPNAYSALIQSSAATRIETTFSRYNMMSGAPSSVFAGAGHAIRGFSN